MSGRSSAISTILALLCVAGLVGGCGPKLEPAPGEVVVGLVIVGDDGQRWADAFTVEAFGAGSRVRVVRASTDGPASVGLAVRRHVADGADVVLCLGRGCGAAVMAEAPRHRETRFVSVPAVRPSANLVGVELRGAGAGYLAGVAAVSISGNTSPVGVLEGDTDRWFEEVARGFETGVAVRGPRRQPLLRTRDPQALLEAGVDIVLVSPSAKRPPAGMPGTPAMILVDGTRDDLGRDGVMGVIQADRGGALLEVLRTAVDGGFVGGRRVFGLESGFVDFALDPTAPILEDEGAIQRLEEAREAVLTGIVAVESFGL